MTFDRSLGPERLPEVSHQSAPFVISERTGNQNGSFIGTRYPEIARRLGGERRAVRRRQAPCPSRGGHALRRQPNLRSDFLELGEGQTRLGPGDGLVGGLGRPIENLRNFLVAVAPLGCSVIEQLLGVSGE